MRFRFHDHAKIEHLNVRKEGPEDDKELKVDLKISAITDMAVADFLETNLRHFLWTHEGMARNPNIKAVQFSGSVGDCTAEMLGLTLTGIKARKFSIEPADVWRTRLTMVMTFQPSANEVAILTEMIGEGCEIKLEGAPTLDADPVDPTDKASESQDPAPTLTPIEALAASVGDDEAMLVKAIDVVRTAGRASISLVQRNLGLGYNRAARLIEAMEARGIVSAMAASGTRSILKEA